ncbi:MAG TPA: hypothetical protein VJ302_23570 [Blastocatellia bacterium]|nr:hypothetical protein [Blastocatellia bacterium]
MTVIDHIRENEMESFWAGDLPVLATIRCAEHLEACPECSRLFRRISSGDRSLAVGGALLAPEVMVLGRHLDYEQLDAYLERRVGADRASSIKLHLELCQECAKDLSSLKEFRRSLDSELRLQAIDQGLLKRILCYVGQIRYPNPVYLFGALALVLGLGLLTQTVFRRSAMIGSFWPRAEVTPPNYQKDELSSVAPGANPRSREDSKSPDETIIDHGKQFVVRDQNGRLSLSHVAPELQEDAARIVRGENLGVRPRALSPQQMLSQIREAGARYSSHFELGIYYLKAGLVEQARNEFQQLRSINPGSRLVERICREHGGCGGPVNPQK